MKKFLFLLALPIAAQTVIDVPFTLPNAAVADALVWTRTQVTNSSPSATLTGALTAGATTFTISSATGYSATDLFANAGATLLIDSEEITCATLTGAVYSGCSRAQQGTTAATHALGATVQQLKYATNSSLLKALLLPGLIQAIQSLPSSNYLGTLTTAQTTAQVNLINAIAPGTIVK